MIYNHFKNLQLSALGMGAMRLPVIGDSDSNIDENATKEMVAYAMEKGVNYFDTAWGYHGGRSESVMGKILQQYPRESYYLADKFPGYDLSNMDKAEAVFEEQLKKCGTEYFDFYMFHNVCEMNIDAYLDEKYGLLAYFLEQKERGRIRHLGFSVHGGNGVFSRFLDAYGDKMEFCQIQLNYVDWDFQDAKMKVEMLNERHIPILVMEPLRGGQLADMPEEYAAEMKKYRAGETAVSWAFRFVQSVPGVAVTLSGMSNFEQMKENIAIFETDKPLSPPEKDALLTIGQEMVSRTAVPCTACRYCMSYCPQNLDIPYLLSLYNEYCFTNGGFIAPMALMALPDDKKPSACLSCRKCEEVCPQQIKISEVLADFSSKL